MIYHIYLKKEKKYKIEKEIKYLRNLTHYSK